jgi:hypothetical protein
MSNIQIPNLPAAIAFSGDELFELVQAGTSVRGSLRQAYIGIGVVSYTIVGGGTVTQTTDKYTGVTLNADSGRITMAATALNAYYNAPFTVSSTNFLITDTPVVVVITPSGKYRAWISGTRDGSYDITVENTTGSILSEAVQLQVNIIKGSISS